MNELIYSRPDQYQTMLENYASIVEKTNQQLSIWSNPYGIMIGILTVILAVIAIVVAWYIWKSSKEQKDLFKKALLKYQKSLDGQAKIFIEQKALEIDKTIKDFERLKESVTEEKKSEFQKVIDEYKNEKARIYREPVNVQYDNNTFYDISVSSAFSDLIKSTHCTECGTFFKYRDDANNRFSALTAVPIRGQRKKVYCPNCAAENFLF